MSGGGIKLPERSTRGKRMRAALDDDEEEADAQFWNQEFFAEEALDEDYEEEQVSEDVPDSDFDEPEEEEDEDEAQDVDERPKRKVLKAPEPKAAPKPKPAKPAQPKEPAEPSPKKVAVEVREPEPEIVYAAPTLRRSTMVRVAEAEKQRQVQAKNAVKPKPSKGNEWRPLTQAELLAEAARTEIDNTYSLRLLLAIEEETKKKAQVVKQQYKGPLVRLASRRRPSTAPPAPAPPPPPAQPTQQATAEPGGEPAVQAAGEGGGGGTAAAEQQEVTPHNQYEATLVYELHHMPYPPLWLRRHRLPPAPPPPLCMVTGAPAKYRDPATGIAYSCTTAFRRLKGLAPLRSAPPPPAPVPLASGKFNTSNCAFPGAASRQLLSDTTKRVMAALPPEPAPLPPPSADFTAVPLNAVPPHIMSLVMDVANGVIVNA